MTCSDCETSLSLLRECGSAFTADSEPMKRWHKSYVANHLTRLAEDLDLVRAAVPPGARILEVGSTPFVLTAALARSGYRVTGCDLEPARYASAIAALALPVVKCNVETEPLPFTEGQFDLVLFNEIFEHLRINPIFTLRQAHRVLRPGGLLMLSSPNLRSLGGIYNFLRNNRAYSCSAALFEEYEKLETLGHMGHVREYTTTEVGEFLGKIGFEVERLIYRGGYRSAGRRLITRIMPSLKPFVSYLARRPAAV